MKNRSTGRLGGLFFNAVTLESCSPGSVVMKKGKTTDAGLRHSSMTLCDGRQSGFTLIELLIVVLIIGILSAVALPQYQKAVDKSRYATLMPVATDVKNAQETFYMASAEYTDDLQNLDIQLPGTVNGNKAEFGDGVKVEVSADGTNDYVAASKDGLDNKYVMYFAQSANFPQEIHCEALTSSERAKQLCLGMGGTEVGANGAYTAYVLEGSGSGTLSGDSTGGAGALVFSSWDEFKKLDGFNGFSRSPNANNGYLGYSDNSAHLYEFRYDADNQRVEQRSMFVLPGGDTVYQRVFYDQYGNIQSVQQLENSPSGYEISPGVYAKVDETGVPADAPAWKDIDRSQLNSRFNLVEF